MTWRSVTLGLAGTVVICALTPYNDYALNNTFMVGNNLPLGVVLTLFLLTVCVNGPLSRFRPALALTSGEVAVAMSMVLVSCALPSSGLMRYLPASLVVPLYHARADADFAALLAKMDLPSWLFPTFSGPSVKEWMNDRLVSQFMTRVSPEDPVPYAAWLTPMLTWGIFCGALYVALLCMVALVRVQWMENERLPFPLAQIQLALVEQPQPRRYLNSTLQAKPFWCAAVGVFLLHAWNGLSRTYPKYFPEIWVYYDFTQLFAERPWAFVDQKIKDSAIFFAAVGVTFFLTAPVAFSLWFFFILHNIRRMLLGMATGDPTVYGVADEHAGGVMALAMVIFYVGRRHWRMVLAQAMRGRRAGEPHGRYLSYPMAFWGLVVSALVMMGWLVAAGASVLMAVVVVPLLLLLFLVIGRIIAETGLIHGQLQVALFRPWTDLVIGGVTMPVPVKSFYFTSLLHAQHYDFREVVPVYGTHAARVADSAVFDDQPGDGAHAEERRTGHRLIACMGIAIAVGYFVSFTSMIRTEYRHAWTKDIRAMRVNEWGAFYNPAYQVVAPTVQYSKQNYNPRHDIVTHLSMGFGITSLLALLRLRFTWWPLHPIGFLMIPTFPGAHLWLSIFIGWLAKVLIVRFGGPALYMRAKPFFLGLIVGESLAAGFWMCLGMALSAAGIPFRAMNIMPG